MAPGADSLAGTDGKHLGAQRAVAAVSLTNCH